MVGLAPMKDLTVSCFLNLLNSGMLNELNARPESFVIELISALFLAWAGITTLAYFYVALCIFMPRHLFDLLFGRTAQ